MPISPWARAGRLALLDEVVNFDRRKATAYIPPASEGQTIMPDNANDNDSKGDVEQGPTIAKRVADAEEARRILGQFSKLMKTRPSKH